jgi:hypothetical protein
MESETIVIEDYYGQVPSLDVGTSVVVGAAFVDPGRKRKRSVFGENAYPSDVHPGLYSTVMDVAGFSPEALMVALRHLFENRAHGNVLFIWQRTTWSSSIGSTWPSTTTCITPSNGVVVMM